MPATHDAYFSANIFEAQLPGGEVPFGRQVLLDDGSTLGSDDYRIYSDRQDAIDDNDANELSDFALDAVEAALGEGVDDIAIWSVDISGGDTWDGELDSLRSSDLTYFVTHISSRTDADVETASTSAETYTTTESGQNFELFIAQSSNTDIKDTSGDTLPTELADADDQDWTAIRYHDDDSEPSEVRWAANRLRFDLDETSPPWEGPMKNGAPLVTSLSSTERTQILNKDVAVGLPLGDEDVYVAAGVVTSGRPIYEQATTAWFVTRVLNRLRDKRVEYSDRGDKIPINTDGQILVRNEISAQIKEGEDEEVGHFDAEAHQSIRDDSEDALITFPDITDADISNRRIRVNVQLIYEVDAIEFQTSFYFDRPPL
jgi:hypothetical protein